MCQWLFLKTMEGLENCQLDFPTFEFWYEALRTDDIETMRKQLDASTDTCRNKLLNGNFCFEDSRRKNKSSYMKYLIASNVWHLVVTLCSEETIKLFIHKGVNIQSKNDFHYNIIHYMIITAAYKPEVEDRMMRSYRVIMDNVSIKDRFELLHHENNEGLRPLEFAMNIAATGLFQGIHHLSNIYIYLCWYRLQPEKLSLIKICHPHFASTHMK